MNYQKFPRRHYLDNLRWMTVILVVIYHTLMMYSSVIPLGTLGESGVMYPTDSIMYFLYPWFMVLLFIISGISARISLTNHPDEDKKFLKKRTVRYLVPSTLGLLAFQWIQGYISMKLSDSFANLGAVPKLGLYLIMSVSGTGVLWYLQTLWIFSLVLVIIRKITKKREKLYPKTENFPFWGMLLLMIPAFGFAQILNTPVIVSYRFGIYGFAFFAGYYLFAHEEVIEKLSNYCIPLLIISVLTGIGYTVFFWGQNFADNPVLNHPFSIAYAWLMCLALLGFGRKYLNFQNPVTAWFSSKSFGLYVFHYLGMSASAYLLHEYTSLPFMLCGVLSLISSFGIGWGLYEIISRIPVLRWFVLGIRKERSQEHVQ
ncbi:MAG: acyltransferase [Oscillospiraceae bacterium]|nr:acyltransferase [Oscillospiraceae bacterium]